MRNVLKPQAECNHIFLQWSSAANEGPCYEEELKVVVAPVIGYFTWPRLR